MIFLNELKDGILYKKPSYLSIDQKNKKTGSAVFLLTPDYDSSKKILGSEMILQKYFESYFIEKDITYYINQENALVRKSDTVINEGFFSKPKKIEEYKESEFLADYKNIKKKLAKEKLIILDKDDPLHAIINNYKENYLWANDIFCRYLLYSDTKTGAFLPILTFTDSFEVGSHARTFCIGCKKENVKNKVFLYCIYSEDESLIGDISWIEFKYKNNTNESYIVESYIHEISEFKFNQLYKNNVEMFESGGSNVLFVTGVSGSGKSTMAREIAKITDSVFIELDRFQFYGNSDKDSLLDKYYTLNPNLKQYTKYHWNNCSNEVFHSEFVKYFEWLMNQIKSDKKTKYVVEGIQLYKHIEPDVLKSYPIIIINKSLQKVYLQRIKREREQYGMTFKDILSGFTSLSNLKDTLNAMRNLRSFQKSINEDFYKDAESYDEYIIESNNLIGHMTQTFISNEMFLRCKLDGTQKYTETVDIECIDEFSVASKIDDKFKPIKKIDIHKIRKIKLDENSVNKYKSEYPSLHHLRTSSDYTGYLYIYNNQLVGYVNVNKETHTIQAMEIFKDFQGMGLSEDLMKDWTTLKGDNLTVNKDNHVAIAIYKKHGFKVYKSTDTMLFMKLNSSKIQQIKEFSDVMIVYPDCLNESFINETSGNPNNTLLRKLMYAERFRTPKEVFAIYDQVKTDFPWINKTYLTYDRYRMYNIFIDLSFYNQTFFKNNIYKLDRGINLYFDFVNRFLNDSRLLSSGYTNRTVIIPVNDWKSEGNVWMYNEDINPISMITRLAIKEPEKFRDWAGINFVFMSDNAYFKIDFATFDKKSVPLFLTLIKKLKNNEQPIDDPNDNITDSKQAIVTDIIDRIETSQKIKINNLTGDSGEITKDELVKKVTQAASVSSDVEQALDELDKDAKLKEIIAALSVDEDDTIKLNAARTARMSQLNDEFLNKEINSKPIRDLLKEPEKDELPVTALKIDSVNPEWQEMKYMNFEKAYDVDADIVKILMSFSKKSIPIAMRDITVTDTSTAEDWIYTYNVQCEDGLGQRYSLKFDIPKFKDNKFMLLRGNEKTINGQLVQIPIMKTDEDTVQIVSNYNKIFVRRFGTTTGKSFVTTDRIIKALNKYEGKGIKITRGDNSKISMKYDLPIDYIDLGSEFSTLELKDHIIYFNQDEIRSKYNIDSNLPKNQTEDKRGIPFIYGKKDKKVFYYNSEEPMSNSICNYLTLDPEFRDLFLNTKPATKYTYSKASILNTEIPVIVVMGYTCGLLKALTKSGIQYTISDKKDKNTIGQDFIKFKDGYINYTLNYDSSLLMNGLKDCNTEDYLLSDMNNKAMWLDFLDLFGGRIKADGLDNFTDLMIDPITEEVLNHYKLPTDYIELLAYANRLLEDNKFIKHTSTNGRRYRSNEIIAGYVYKALSEAYGDFKNKSKRISKGSIMTIKQTEVIDKILLDPTASDLSILNPLLEIESANAVSYKGLSGMNSDRAYNLDKRTFDDSMVNVLALSTGFAGNVGITRQATVDMNIEGKRGYIKETKNKEDLSVTKTLCMTEALTPFGTTRDDPFRSAMTFIQTSKHSMRIKNSCPQLITNGADEALPYMVSNTFTHKSKMSGKVIEKTDDYMILAYKDGSKEMVNLIEEVKKNSSGGFFTTIKLDTNLKVGSTFKENEILAYDKLSFSNKIGNGDNLSYNLGALVKIAILNTDEGYEDSTIISDWLSSAMSSEVVVKKEITLPKNTNIYKMAKVGQPIQEGEPLLIFQNAFDEEDVNILLKNLSGDESEISELGRISIKSKITGVVQDIKMYRTVEKDEMSDSLKKQFNNYEKPIKELKKVIEKHKVSNPVNLEPDYKLEPIGKLKNAKDSILIEFYLKYEDRMSVGDKLIDFSALKGVIKDIFPIGKEPYSQFRKDEIIHSLLAIGSVNGRMVCSVQVNALINKILIELDRKVKEKLGLKFKMLDEM